MQQNHNITRNIIIRSSSDIKFRNAPSGRNRLHHQWRACSQQLFQALHVMHLSFCLLPITSSTSEPPSSTLWRIINSTGTRYFLILAMLSGSWNQGLSLLNLKLFKAQGVHASGRLLGGVLGQSVRAFWADPGLIEKFYLLASLGTLPLCPL